MSGGRAFARAYRCRLCSSLFWGHALLWKDEPPLIGHSSGPLKEHHCLPGVIGIADVVGYGPQAPEGRDMPSLEEFQVRREA